MTLTDKKHIYFIGIGGISMSGLAEILLNRGYEVSGSDISKSETVGHLLDLGVKVNIGQKAENITSDIDLVVYTAAVKADNPERVASAALGIEIIDRAQLMGIIMAGYKTSVAVSGTHGKTTTTSMISEITMAASLDPTLSIGGILPSINGTTRIGKSDYFVAEACEYCDSFLRFYPFVSVILNIDADHLDYFKNIENIRRSFKTFAEQTSPEGIIVINGAIDNYNEIVSGTKARVVTYGFTPASDFYPKNISFDIHGYAEYDLYYRERLMGRIKLSVPGDHNVSNSLAAIAAAVSLGIDFEAVKDGLKTFGGTHRRFEFKGEFNGVKIYDDYAHHPTEIMATLAAARKSFPDKKIWCVFQPHTYSRTLTLMKEFSEAFSDADNIIITDIYAAREKDTGIVHSRDLVKNIEAKSKNAVYLGDFSEIENYVISHCTNADLLITMGAGDIFLVGEKLVKR